MSERHERSAEGGAVTDWFDKEPRLASVLIAELWRLKRRAQARWPLVLAIGIALSAAVVWKAASKPAQYRARVVLAITEGANVSGRDATPLHELRDYIGNILLTNAEILKLIEKHGLMRTQRRTMGDDFAIASFRDNLGIGVWRNYFQYSYSYDEQRTARVATVFTATDREFAYEMARALANITIQREGERRVQAADELLVQSRGVLDAVRARLVAARSAQHDVVVELAEAEARGDAGAAAIARMRASELTLDLTRAEEQFFTVEATTTNEALQAAVTAAGMAIDIQVVDERKPPKIERSSVVLFGTALVALCIFLPLAGVLIGAFDTRVHDLDDVERLDLTPLGHLPGFPGDQVGALRDRGVPRRRVPSWVPWR
jgi:hypothetical protein